MHMPCPNCKKTVNVPDGLVNGKARCGHCHQVFAFPAIADALPADDGASAEQGIRATARPEPARPGSLPSAPAASAAATVTSTPAARTGVSPVALALVAGGLVLGIVVVTCLGGVGWLFLRTSSPSVATSTDAWGGPNGGAGTKVAGVRDPWRRQPETPVPEDPALPLFPASTNPFRIGTQTRLREVGNFKAPGNVVQLAYSPKHELLFLRNSGTGVWVIDVKTQKELGMQEAREQFYDLGLSADESALFVADYGGEQIGYGTPLRPHHLHRYDLAKRTWERRIAPKIAGRLETVDAHHVLLLARDQWVDVTLNRWEANQERVTEVARAHAGRVGDIAYNPRTGWVYHSGYEINVLRVRSRSLTKGPGDPGDTERPGGGSLALAADGKYLYVGGAQIEALDVQHTVESMPERIFAASRDLAFGENAYYETKGAKVAGKLGFRCTAYDIDIHGLHLWAYDAGSNTLHHYRLEGDK